MVGHNESRSRWPHAAENARGTKKKKQKLTKPDTKNSIYKHPKRRRRRSRRRQGTAAQSFANESTIFYCHCWALNAKHKHAHKHTQIKETNNLDHLFAFTLCSCACCLISIYLYNFNLSALRGRTPHKSKVFLTYTAGRENIYTQCWVVYLGFGLPQLLIFILFVLSIVCVVLRRGQFKSRSRNAESSSR